MFVQILILVIVSAVQATYLHGGKSFSSRKDDGYGNYVFSYDIEDPLGATNGRYEIGDAHGNKKGGYTITDIDGRVRRVEYVADKHGFRAVVHTNEPGTAASRPASALISSPYVVKQPPIHDVPVSTVKRVVRPVAVVPVAPVPVGSVKKVVRPVFVDRISQTIHEEPIGSVKTVVRPVAIDHVSQTIHDVPVGTTKRVFRPVAVDHVSQTVHDVPVAPIREVFRPVAVDDISQTVHDVPIGSVKEVSHPVAVEHVSQTVHDVPVGSWKETRRPLRISQTVHPPQEIFATDTHHVNPIVSQARTFRAAQAAHAASIRPNLYNGEYSVKYVQPAPPVVKKFRPSGVHRWPLPRYSGAPSTYSLQPIDSPAVHASPAVHVKGTPFYQSGLFRHVYGSSLQKPVSFRSHLL